MNVEKRKYCQHINALCSKKVKLIWSWN